MLAGDDDDAAGAAAVGSALSLGADERSRSNGVTGVMSVYSRKSHMRVSVAPSCHTSSIPSAVTILPPCGSVSSVGQPCGRSFGSGLRPRHAKTERLVKDLEDPVRVLVDIALDRRAR